MRKPHLLRVTRVAVPAVILLALGARLATGQSTADNPLATTKNGVSLTKAGAYEGYSLIAPMNSTKTYLVDLQGKIVREWKSDYTPALSAYLLENGHLLRPAADRQANGGGFAPGAGGRIQEFDWDGNLVWNYAIDIEGLRPHHDICRLPNGNVLVIATEHKTTEQAVAAGRRPESVGEQLLPDCLLEIKPTGATTGEVVWEWHAWDHLIQDVDKSKPDYGEVAEHPERIDVNFGSREFDRMLADPQQLARLRSLGYVGGGGTPQRPPEEDDRPDPAGAQNDRPPGDEPRERQGGGNRADGQRDGRPAGGDRGRRGGPMQGDWMHANSVAYSPELDQIVLSIHNFSEIWIIDHGTTTAEAASKSGGKRGKGGDLLYRWGNPQAYRSGSRNDQRLFAQHCASWIPAGLPGTGHLLVFNNGQGRPDGAYSSVDEIAPPLAPDGTYQRDEFLAFGPDQASWSFTAGDKSSFFSMLISGAQRLPNGNTYICSGNQAILFEVTPAREIVWVYKHPGGGMGFPGMNGPGRMGMFPDFVRGMLNIDDQQGKKLTALQADVDKQLADVLTRDQRKILEQPPMFGGPPGGGPRGGGGRGDGAPGDGPPDRGPREERLRDQGPPDGDPADRGPRADRGPDGDRPSGGPRGRRGFRPPRFGDVIPFFVVGALEMSEAQQQRVAQIQAHVDTELKQILTDHQQKQIEEMARMFARGPGSGPPGGSPPGAGPDGDRPPPNEDERRPRDRDRPEGDRPEDSNRPGPGGDGPGGFGRGRGGPGFGRMFGGPGGPGGRGPGGMFRSYRYGPDFPGLVGKDLTPGASLAEVAEKELPPPRGDRPQPPPEPDAQ